MADGMIEVQVGSTADPAAAAAAEQVHNEQMIKVAETGDTSAAAGEGETLLAGKYKTQEDLQKGTLELLVKQNGGNLEAAYKALEQAQGSAASADDASAEGAGKDEGEGGGANAEQGSTTDTNQQTTVVADATAEYAEKGELSEDTYKALEKVGLSKDMVDIYIEGQKAKFELTTQRVYQRAGSQEDYNAMLTWAKEGYTPTEAEAFNKAIASGDEGQMMTAIDALKTRYMTSNGFELGRIRPGQTGGPGAGDVYNSWAEAKADMSDPRYGKDPAFTRQVEQKVGRSKI